MSRDVFTYGTLQFPEIFAAVTGIRPARRGARLDGFARYRVRGESYPAVTTEPGASVRGVLWHQVPPAARRRIEVFEGELYAPRTVTVVTDDGRRRPALCWVARPGSRGALDDARWDPAELTPAERERFRRRCRRLRHAVRRGRDGSGFA